MKAVKILLLVSLMGIVSCHSQTESKTSNLKKDKKEMNLLDTQTSVYGQIFDLARAEDKNPLGGATNYLELIEKMKTSEELKQQLREMYKVYNLSLDPKKKDSLKLMVDKMLKNAMEKTKNKIKQ